MSFSVNLYQYGGSLFQRQILTLWGYTTPINQAGSIGGWHKVIVTQTRILTPFPPFQDDIAACYEHMWFSHDQTSSGGIWSESSNFTNLKVWPTWVCQATNVQNWANNFEDSWASQTPRLSRRMGPPKQIACQVEIWLWLNSMVYGCLW